MPYETVWRDPDVALTHNGVTIYCTYKDDEYERPLDLWYTTTLDAKSEFDVRDIPGFDEQAHNIDESLKRAIDNGWLTPSGLSVPEDRDV